MCINSEKLSLKNFVYKFITCLYKETRNKEKVTIYCATIYQH